MLRFTVPALSILVACMALGADNIALGRPYALSPAPNYPLCTDEGDGVQFTDGRHTDGYFWTQPSTVGWSEVQPVLVTVDLGADLPVDGVSFSTASRPEAGVLWPRAILLRVSTDGETWHPVGELVGLATVQGTLPEPQMTRHGHMLRSYRATGLATHGRYVSFVVAPNGQYCFADEVEVYRGADSPLDAPLPGPVLSSPTEALDTALADSEIAQVILGDAASIGRDLADSSVPADLRGALQAELLQVLRGPLKVPPLAYQETFPLNDMHRRVLELGARVWQAQGRPALQVWSGGRWDPLQPRSAPPVGAAPTDLRVTLMRGEVRSAVLNLTNTLTRARTLALSLDGLAEQARKAIGVHQVAWTFSGTSPVAAVLPETPRSDGRWRINVPAGATRQVWFMVDARGLPPTAAAGQIALREGSVEVARVPFRLRVSPVCMPAKLSLALGGWDYTDGPGLYHLSEPLRQSLVGFLQAYGVDAPWASKQVMPFGRHAADGAMTEPPDTSSMDEWLRLWPGSRLYCVFSNFEGTDALGPGLPFGTPAWERAVGEWIRFWVAHLGKRGISVQQLCLLLVDEPRNPDLDQLTITYAQAIRAGEPNVVIWTDPIWQNPARANPKLYDVANVIAPQRSFWLAAPEAHEQVFGALQQAGKELAFYSCSGPVRALDPYSYHLLQAWDCFRHGMDQEFFWSFGGGGGMAPWNQVGPENMVFTPQYRTPDGWITSRHMEAIREGRYDYEYLCMLREQIVAAQRSGVDGRLIERARRLLASVPDDVLGAPGATSLWWATDKDRSRADRARLRALLMLEALDRAQSETEG